MALGPQFEQLKMFMTPKEIMKDYDPLGGDRHEIPVDHLDDPNAYRVETNEEVWDRKSEEAHLSKDEYNEIRGVQSRGTFTSMWSKLHGDGMTGGPGPEPEEQTGHTSSYILRKDSWNDKVHQFIDDNIDFHSKDKTSIADSIRKSGVQSPVRLGPTKVTGGHHRIAAANTINPDMLIPVLHEQEDRPHKEDRVYPYT